MKNHININKILVKLLLDIKLVFKINLSIIVAKLSEKTEIIANIVNWYEI